GLLAAWAGGAGILLAGLATSSRHRHGQPQWALPSRFPGAPWRDVGQLLQDSFPRPDPGRSGPAQPPASHCVLAVFGRDDLHWPYPHGPAEGLSRRRAIASLLGPGAGGRSVQTELFLCFLYF